jgi:hypothetical protein
MLDRSCLRSITSQEPLHRYSIYCTYYQLSEGEDSELIAVTTSLRAFFQVSRLLFITKADYYPSPIHVHN